MNDAISSVAEHFDYDLPPSLIAQKPADPRDSSRLLCVDRRNNEITHHKFYDLPSLIDNNSLLVINDTKVYPARIFGRKKTGGRVEILLVRRLGNNRWEAYSRPGVKEGAEVYFDDFYLKIMERREKIITVEPSVKEEEFMHYVDSSGIVPTPPYISSPLSQNELKKSYQTVYAKETGSAAAPTAGLHFTPKLFNALAKHGVQTATLTLHVGLGTFAPIEEKNLKEKKLHKEFIEVTEEEANKINNARAAGRTIIAVGTTSARTLESVGDMNGVVKPFSGETSLFIYPGYKFNVVDGLITNFHLPQSSLLMLVSALCSKPNTNHEFKDFSSTIIGRAYAEAVENNYRFFSFGDACLIR